AERPADALRRSVAGRRCARARANQRHGGHLGDLPTLQPLARIGKADYGSCVRAQLTYDLDGRRGDVSLPSVYTIGRSPTCDLVLDHLFVSNVHCTFILEPHGVALIDHESSNGTLV